MAWVRTQAKFCVMTVSTDMFVSINNYMLFLCIQAFWFAISKLHFIACYSTTKNDSCKIFLDAVASSNFFPHKLFTISLMKIANILFCLLCHGWSVIKKKYFTAVWLYVTTKHLIWIWYTPLLVRALEVSWCNIQFCFVLGLTGIWQRPALKPYIWKWKLLESFGYNIDVCWVKSQHKKWLWQNDHC